MLNEIIDSAIETAGQKEKITLKENTETSETNEDTVIEIETEFYLR